MHEREPAELVLRLLVRILLVPRECDDVGPAGRQRNSSGGHLRLELHLSNEERRRLCTGTQLSRQDGSTICLHRQLRKRTGELMSTNIYESAGLEVPE